MKEQMCEFKKCRIKVGDLKIKLEEAIRTEKHIKSAIVSATKDMYLLGVDLQKMTENLPIEDVLLSIKLEIQPEILPIAREMEGERIVILRSPVAPQYGFILLAEKSHSSKWQIAFRTENGPSREFSVLCACCPIEERYSNLSKKESDALTSDQRSKYRDDFYQALSDVCRKYGISSLFLRLAKKWEESYKKTFIQLLEADKAPAVIKETIGKEVEDVFPFVDWDYSLHNKERISLYCQE